MLKILGVMLVVIGVMFWGAVMTVYSTGVVVVEVHEKGPSGTNLFLPVPVILAHAAIAFVPEEQLREVRAELGPRKDLVIAACEEMSRCPDDTVFVQYKSEDEEVIVRKEGDALKVLADTADGKVRVRVPISSVRNLVDQLAD